MLDAELSAIFDLQLKDFRTPKQNNIPTLNNQISTLMDEIKPYLEAFQPKSSNHCQ